MAKQKSTGLLVNGSVKAAGVTFYTRHGQTVVRSARSVQPERRSRGQFDQRMRMRHTIALWHVFRASGPLFGEGVTAYRRFASAANRLTPVYVPCNGPLGTATFLLPGIPVSAGPTASIKEWFGKVDGEDVLLTNLRPADLERHEELRLCCLRQSLEGAAPQIVVSWRTLALPNGDESHSGGEPHLRLVDGKLAVFGGALADPMFGWALVRVDGDRCSTQAAVTRSTYYERFTTDNALNTAAESYGGLTK